MRPLDLAEQRFGHLTAMERCGTTKRRSAIWLCKCDCGGTKEVPGERLRSGAVTSCGCRGNVSEKNSTHGFAPRGARKPPEYGVWSMMKDRCGNRNNNSYPNYGGRGISVCDRWASDFAAFLTDMGPRPGPGYSIDRIDNDGDYEPGNCRWATMTEQAANRRPRGPNRRPYTRRAA